MAYREPRPPSLEDKWLSKSVVAKCLIILAALVLCWLFVLGCNELKSRVTPKPGEIIVVRNGPGKSIVTDWFDDRKIRQIIDNGAGSTFRGLGSEDHAYPVKEQQRYFRLQTCVKSDDHTTEVPCEGADDVAIEVPTSDGVQVGIEGNFYLHTGFDSSDQGHTLVRNFDTQFGTRTFEGQHVWDGTDGYKKFLHVIFEPVIANNLRQIISGVSCAELVSSCALVQNSTAGATKTAALTQARANKNNIAQVEKEVNEGLQVDLNTTLKGNYYEGVEFKLTKVDLPKQVQDAVNNAQSAFATVSEAEAEVKSAVLKAEANKKKQNGYQVCPACARIAELEALPSNLTTYAPGAAFAVGR